MLDRVFTLLSHHESCVRAMSSASLHAFLVNNASLINTCLGKLHNVYSEKATIKPPEYDSYGIVIPETLNRPNEWQL